MAYLSVADAKAYLGLPVSDTAEDALLALLTAAAQSAIDAHCGRSFEAAAATRYYGQSQVLGRELRLDQDLLSVATLTNGDGAAIAPAAFALVPRNTLPAYAIRLKGATVWTFTDVDSEIAVEGMWGYSATPPALVLQAVREYVDYMYRTPDARRGTNVAEGAAGAVVARSGDVPEHIGRLLSNLRRSGW